MIICQDRPSTVLWSKNRVPLTVYSLTRTIYVFGTKCLQFSLYSIEYDYFTQYLYCTILEFLLMFHTASLQNAVQFFLSKQQTNATCIKLGEIVSPKNKLFINFFYLGEELPPMWLRNSRAFPQTLDNECHGLFGGSFSGCNMYTVKRNNVCMWNN